MANLITLARVLLIFLVIAVWGRDRGVTNVWVDLAMVPVLATAIIMDALDGWAARRLHEESKAGALFDIAGDRIVELTLWTFFAIRRDGTGAPLVPLWVPLVMILRTVLTDLVRSVAFGDGKTPFGAHSLQSAAWARWLTSSAWSRGAYGVLKTLTFCGLGVLIAAPRLWPGSALIEPLRLTMVTLVHATVALSVLRAVPVLWDGRRYLTGGSAAALLLAVAALALPARADAQADTQARTVVARGVAIHVTESRPAVAGEPWLLLIHGFGASSESWHDVEPLLSPAIRVVRLDLRGFGRSGMPRDTLYAPTEQAEIVADLLPRLGTGPVIVAGHSYGGAVAFLTYLRLRSRGEAKAIAGLALMDAAAYPQEYPFFISVLRNPFTRFLSERLTSASWRTRFTLERIFVRRERIDDARVERYARPLRRDGAEYALAQVARQVSAPDAAALADSVGTIDVPTLILWGEQDPVIPLANARRLHADIRGSELVVITRSGHVPQEEYPEATAAALLRFVERVRSPTALPVPRAP